MQELQVESLQRAVARDRRHHQPLHPFRRESGRELGRGGTAGLGPPARRRLAFLHVDAASDLGRAEARHRLARERGPLGHRRPQDDARGARLQRELDVAGTTDAAADLHRHRRGCLDDPGDQGRLPGLAESGVEIRPVSVLRPQNIAA